jgi:hypothetical protein
MSARLAPVGGQAASARHAKCGAKNASATPHNTTTSTTTTDRLLSNQKAFDRRTSHLIATSSRGAQRQQRKTTTLVPNIDAPLPTKTEQKMSPLTSSQDSPSNRELNKSIATYQVSH